MADEYWQVTAEMYGSLFQKPKMTQKLLMKPPFRYIHDIFTTTMTTTNFGNGLLAADEVDGKAITEKQAKANFLMKIIQLTELVVGEELDVKPGKIIAGQEPEKTNAFLQAMFKAATAGIDTTPHVQQITGGGAMGDDGAAAQQEEAMQQQQQMEAEAAAAEEEQRKRAEQDARRKKKKDAERRRQEEERQRVEEEEAERHR